MIFAMKRLLLICIMFLISGQAWAGWELITPMPHARFGHDATLGPDGKIYVMGGLVAEEKGSPPVQQPGHDGIYSNLVYDPATGSWQYREPVPGRYSGEYYLQPDTEKETWKNGWIELGYLHSENNDHFEILNPKSRKGEIVRISIDKLRNTDFRRYGDGVEIVAMPDNRIWWIGGRKSVQMGRGESLVLAYDPQTDTWPHYIPKSDKRTEKSGFQTDIPEMNERRMAHEAVRTADGKIFVFGGWRYDKEEKEIKGRKVEEPYYAYTKQVATDTVECYDPKTNQWTYRTSMSSKRLEHAAVLGPDGNIYVFGGAKSPSDALAHDYLDTTEVYDPDTDTWSQRKSMPAGKAFHAAVLGSDNRIYILGGSEEGESSRPLGDVYIYDPAKDSWSRGPSMNIPRSTLAAVATPDGKIYAIGGTDDGAYKTREKLNFFLPKKVELYSGKLQKTVEVLDLNE